MNIAWSRVSKAVLCAGVGLAAGILGGDWIVGNSDAIDLIATIFSVLAGFLIAVMALIADERLLVGKAKRLAYFEAKNARRKLVRHKLLFQLYLVVMLLAFGVTLDIGLPPRVSEFCQQTMLGLAVFAFLISFALPSQITSEYLRKIDDVLKSPPPAA